MNIIVILIIIILIICLNNYKETFSQNNLDNYYKEKDKEYRNIIDKLKYINKNYFNNKGSLFRESSIKFTSKSINDDRIIYVLGLPGRINITNKEYLEITNLLLPEFNKHYNFSNFKTREIIYGINKNIKKLYFVINEFIYCIECNTLKNICKKKKYKYDIMKNKKVKKIINSYHKNNYLLLKSFGKDAINKEFLKVLVKSENNKINYYHISLQEFQKIILNNENESISNILKKRFKNHNFNKILDKYNGSEISYLSFGKDAITFYLNQITI